MDKLKELRKAIKELSVKSELTADDETKLKQLMADESREALRVEAAAKAAKDEADEKAVADKAREDELEAARKEERAKVEKEFATKGRRLPMGEAPYQAQFADTWKYDGLSHTDLALVLSTLRSAGKPLPAPAVKALALKVSELKDAELTGETA